jgi:hypothetical protein
MRVLERMIKEHGRGWSLEIPLQSEFLKIPPSQKHSKEKFPKTLFILYKKIRINYMIMMVNF